MNRRRNFALLLPLLLFQLVGCAKNWQDAYNVELDEDERFVFGTIDVELVDPHANQWDEQRCTVLWSGGRQKIDDTKLIILSDSAEDPAELKALACTTFSEGVHQTSYSYRIPDLKWAPGIKSLYFGHIEFDWRLTLKSNDELPHEFGHEGDPVSALIRLTYYFWKLPGWIRNGYPDGFGYLEYFITNRREETLERIPMQLRKSIVARGVVDGVPDGAGAGEETGEEISPPSPLP